MRWSASEELPARSSARRDRRQQRQLRQGQQEELNLVSMIDVFAVLVFFLLVSSSITATRLNVLGLDLPAPGAVAASASPPLTVSLLRDALLVQGGPGAPRRLHHGSAGYDLAALSSLLVEIKRARPEQTQVTLLVDPEVAYDDVVQVMDRLRATPLAAQAQGLPAELFPLIAIGDAERAS